MKEKVIQILKSNCGELTVLTNNGRVLSQAPNGTKSFIKVDYGFGVGVKDVEVNNYSYYDITPKLENIN